MSAPKRIIVIGLLAVLSVGMFVALHKEEETGTEDFVEPNGEDPVQEFVIATMGMVHENCPHIVEAVDLEMSNQLNSTNSTEGIDFFAIGAVFNNSYQDESNECHATFQEISEMAEKQFDGPIAPEDVFFMWVPYIIQSNDGPSSTEDYSSATGLIEPESRAQQLLQDTMLVIFTHCHVLSEAFNQKMAEDDFFGLKGAFEAADAEETAVCHEEFNTQIPEIITSLGYTETINGPGELADLWVSAMMEEHVGEDSAAARA